MKKIITYLTVAAIVFDVFTPFQLYISGGRALVMLFPTISILLYDRLFTRKTFVPVFGYLLVCFLVMLAGSEYFNYPYFIEVLLAYACFEHFLTTKDYKFAKTVIQSFYVVLLLMVAVSLPLFIAMPNLSRLMLDAEENGIQDPILYWTMQYDTLHALPIYSIPLFYLARNREKMIKYGSIISIIAIFILMFYADTTTGVIVNILVFICLLLYRQNLSLNNNIARLMGGVALMAIVLNKAVLINILRLTQPIFSGSSTYVKIDFMISALSGQGTSGDLESREDLLKISWNSFLSNPLLPELDITKIGQHNFLLDQIVALGLIPAIPFIWFVIERIKRPWKYLTDATRPYYLMGIMVFLLMGSLKSFFLLFPACSILPMLFIYEQKKDFNR